MPRSRNFTGTYNNPPIQGEEFLAVLKALPGCVAATLQLEKGASGTPHFQWFVSIKDAKTPQSIAKKLKGCHVDIARNSFAAWNYCQKEDTRVEGPWEHGIPPAAKNVKGDTAARNKMIMEKSLTDCVKEGIIHIKEVPNIKRAKDILRQETDDLPTLDVLENEWHVGPTGTGKTRHCRTKWPDAYLKNNTKWWEGYADQETVIIDEMGPNQIGGQHMKQWADHYPFPMESKGSGRVIRPKRIIVTSNYTIEECYPEPQDHEPLKRRFTTHIYKTLGA